MNRNVSRARLPTNQRRPDFDAERRADSTGASREDGSESSVQAAPVASIHRQVGNQAIQADDTVAGVPNPFDRDGSQRSDEDSKDQAASEDERATDGSHRSAPFAVTFDDDKVAGWKTVTIPSLTMETGSYREGTEHPTPKSDDDEESDDSGNRE